ncbi:MAG: hypothetical protein J5485_02870, partial [Candidatus Methanomethylophilaceae archaeon]|nr:hypothetical protein [Candidatus Methanomethylophilaceae archaeon]
MNKEDSSSSCHVRVGREARLLILAAVILASVAVISVAIQESDALEEGQICPVDGITYRVLDSETVSAVEIKSGTVHIVVPSTVTGPDDVNYKVKYVDFVGPHSLRTAILEDGIEGIGQ